MRAEPDLSLCEERKPAFDPVEPRGVGRSKVQVVSCSFCNERRTRAVLCAAVVEHEMDFEIGRNGVINLFQEIQEFN